MPPSGAADLWRLFVVALLALTLSACGGGSPSDDGAIPDEPSGGVTPDPDPVPPSSSATSPVQPETGFGGSRYPYAGTTARMVGAGGTAYWLITPAGAGTASLPVVYFLHGYGSAYPTPYRAWIDHLARRGAIVIYPCYQVSTTTPLTSYVPNALAAVKAAIMLLDSESGPRPDRARVTAIGHSIGGVIAINLTARAMSEGIPPPRALMAVNPTQNAQNDSRSIVVEDLGQIPAGTQILTLFSDRDDRVSNQLAKALFYGSTNVPVADKEYIDVDSDTHGPVALLADHFAALAGGDSSLSLYPPDALDFYGYWRLSAALMDSAFGNAGGGRAVALGHGTDVQRDMGAWSDGVPVKRLKIERTP